MWPRTEEERRRQRNSGFVAFMNRADGQAAKNEMQGVVIYEYELKIGWGKSVALPAQALPAPPPGHLAIRNKDGGTVVLSGPDGLPVTSMTNQNSELVLTPNVPDILVMPPDDKHMRHVIDTMALHVLDGGCALEQAIMERGRGNPLFNFLFELGSKEHAYYVWRLYSFAQGDTLQRWRTEPFIMIIGSSRWVPPSLPAARYPEHEKDSSSTYAAGRSRRMEVERSLTDLQRDEFEDLLRALTLERSHIKEAMGLALDNADAAGEIVEVLTESLTLMETPIPTKVARLMLVSDILHNSSAPVKNASAYRTKFEVNLPDIMESFNYLYHSVTGRITAEALKERVLKVLQVWSDWFLFSNAYVNGLRATFLRSGNSGVIPIHSICGDVPEIENKTSTEDLSEGGKLDEDAALAMGKSAAMKELLGLPLAELERRCRHNGVSLVGGREMMVARLLNLEEAGGQREYDRDDDMRYGQSHSHRHSRDEDARHVKTALGRDSDFVTEPLSSTKWNRHGEEAIRVNEDGFTSVSDPAHPFSGSVTRAFSKSGPILPDSKWNRDDDGSDEEDKKGSHGLGLGCSSSGSENVGVLERTDDSEVATDADTFAHFDSNTSEEHRQKLRRLEVAVMEYRESLEERGIRGLKDIERKVSSYRRRLQSEYGLLDSSEGRNKPLSQGISERKEKRDDDCHDSLRKCHRSKSHSRRPPKKPTKERVEADRDRDGLKERDEFHDAESKRGREKSGSRERDDRDQDRARDRRR